MRWEETKGGTVFFRGTPAEYSLVLSGQGLGRGFCSRDLNSGGSGDPENSTFVS